MCIGGVRILKNEIMKYRPCNSRAMSFSVLSFMLFVLTIVGILPSVKSEEKIIVFCLITILFLLHLLFVLYVLLKLNSLVYIDQNRIYQKQFGKIISINYDEINNIKLSFSFYIRASYVIKIYEGNKRIMFEITSKAFDEFVKHCSNIEVKNKIEKLLKEKGIY